MAEICEFGTAPDQTKNGYRGLGITVQGTDEEVLKVFCTGDIRLVRGPFINHSDTVCEFYPMLRDEL